VPADIRPTEVFQEFQQQVGTRRWIEEFGFGMSTTFDLIVAVAQLDDQPSATPMIDRAIAESDAYRHALWGTAIDDSSQSLAGGC